MTRDRSRRSGKRPSVADSVVNRNWRKLTAKSPNGSMRNACWKRCATTVISSWRT